MRKQIVKISTFLFLFGLCLTFIVQGAIAAQSEGNPASDIITNMHLNTTDTSIQGQRIGTMDKKDTNDDSVMLSLGSMGERLKAFFSLKSPSMVDKMDFVENQKNNEKQKFNYRRALLGLNIFF
jgi:hypothetical protein